MKENKKISVTVITHSYPSEHFPISGIFIKDQVDFLSEIVNLRVLAPKPKSNMILSMFKQKWKYFKEIPEYQKYESYEVFRPEYLTYPKRIFYHHVGENFWKSIRTYLDKETDIFHIHFAYPGGSIVTKLKSVFPDKAVFISIHGNDWHMLKKEKKIKNIIYDNFLMADRILTVSKSLRDDIIAYYPDLANKIMVIYNGLNIKSQSNYENSNLFSQKDKIKILVIGAFVKGKGIHVLLKALNKLVSNQHQLIIIGNIIDPQNYSELLKLRDELGLKDQVEFLVSLPRDKVYEYIKSCNYFILPSLKEGFGIALIEALFFGKPVISTFSGGPEEIVNSNNGILVEPGNVEELKEAITEMDQQFLKYDPAKLSADIIERFGMSNIMKKLFDEYKKSIV